MASKGRFLRAHAHALLIAGAAATLVAALAGPGLRAFFALRLPSEPVWVAVALVIAAAHALLQVRSRGCSSRIP